MLVQYVRTLEAEGLEAVGLEAEGLEEEGLKVEGCMATATRFVKHAKEHAHTPAIRYEIRMVW